VAPTFLHTARDEAGTAALGAALAKVLPPGALVALEGTLGAGKTRLVQGVAEAAGVDRKVVTSPTFTLIHEYAGVRPIYHFDAYRLKDDDEFQELGPDEYFSGEGWTFIEWASRVAASLPAERTEIAIDLAGEGRTFAITGYGERMEGVVEELKEMLGAQGT
jgi:tRNA threonylcarbamoyladenosine biosynthesis protein TsaE